MSEWVELKLQNLLEFGNGKVKPKSYGEYPIYGGNGILGYGDNYNYSGETIVIGRVGAYCGAVYYENKQIWISDNALSAKPKQKNDTKFLYYFLKNINLNQFAGGSSHPLVTHSLLNSLEISICIDPNIQKAIAEVLSSLDDKIDLLHRQNKTLEQMAETLFRKWFVEDAKEEWELGFLKDEFVFSMGQSPPGNTYNEEALGTAMYQGNADFGFRFPTPRVFTNDPKRFAEKYDTLISVRAPVGAQNMALEKCCIGRGVSAFRYKNGFYKSYTYYKLRSLMTEIKQFNDTGTVFGSISKSDFEKMEIKIPPVNLVMAFESEIGVLDDKIINNTTQIEILSKQRDILLPKLMSGEVRVKMDKSINC
jgi:type I restriction enzyme S subunit